MTILNTERADTKGRMYVVNGMEISLGSLQQMYGGIIIKMKQDMVTDQHD